MYNLKNSWKATQDPQLCSWIGMLPDALESLLCPPHPHPGSLPPFSTVFWTLGYSLSSFAFINVLHIYHQVIHCFVFAYFWSYKWNHNLFLYFTFSHQHYVFVILPHWCNSHNLGLHFFFCITNFLSHEYVTFYTSILLVIDIEVVSQFFFF